MMLYFYSFVLSLSIFAQAAEAIQIRELNAYEKAHIDISNHEFNRITTLDDRISNIFGMKEQFLIETDEVSGQIFLMVRDQSQTSISLTFVTENGATQDVLLMPKDCAGETIIFKSTKNKEYKASRDTNKGLRTEKEQVDALMRAMIANTEIHGFKVIQLEEFISETDVPREVDKQKIAIYIGKTISGEIYQITNKLDTELLLNEQDFSKLKGAKMISLKSKKLMPGQSTYLYVVKS